MDDSNDGNPEKSQDDTNDPISHLGYDPDESSDYPLEEPLEIRDKADLIRWQYLKGGDRIPKFLPKIPHVKETQFPEPIDPRDGNLSELAKRLTGDVKQCMVEYIYAKQRFDMLQQERDLLKWHLANNSKELDLKESQVLRIESTMQNLIEKIQETDENFIRLDNERFILGTGFEKDTALLNDSLARLDEAKEMLNQISSRRGQYTIETTLERRQAAHERRLRQRQYNKLLQVAAIDKKWHAKIDSLIHLDDIIYDTYEKSVNFKNAEFENAGIVTAPVREILIEDMMASDPLADYDQHVNNPRTHF